MPSRTKRPVSAARKNTSPQARQPRNTIMCPRCNRGHVPTAGTVQAARALAERDTQQGTPINVLFAKYSEYCASCLSQKAVHG